MAPSTMQSGQRLPVIYNLFFLILEPVSALVGAFFTHCRQSHYLQLLDAASAPEELSRGTSVVMSQLASMYLFFALNEAIVLRSTSDIGVWRAVLFVLLIADFVHLYSLRELGLGVYFNVLSWNSADIGNVPWVYAGATMRICFLLGVGLGGAAPAVKPSAKQQ